MWEERVLFHYTLRISKSFSWWIKQCIQRNAVFIFGWLQFIKYLIIVAINACLCSVDISIYCVTKISLDQPPTSNLHLRNTVNYHHNVSTPSQDTLHVISPPTLYPLHQLHLISNANWECQQGNNSVGILDWIEFC